ncbi:hypothetical protein BpHYR1_027172 [Brachionus plicatilis]|uniref:Uncharacterized protein n=1 Tax=Brachionus plicatilis TaxID=10195 RepID=A0A3M7QGK3_BRAPC|nr:hypothetical protein BpHYR1_027172 [Brachionus plicatilis]
MLLETRVSNANNKEFYKKKIKLTENLASIKQMCVILLRNGIFFNLILCLTEKSKKPKLIDILF